MGLNERTPSLLSVTRAQRDATKSVRNQGNRMAATTFSGLSVSGVTSAASQSIFTNDVAFMFDDTCMIEVYAAFTGTMSGTGRVMDLMMVYDGTEFQLLEWTNVTSQTRYTTPESFDGTTATRGSFIVRVQSISAGYHTLNFRFKTTTAGTGSASSGTISYRFS
jgi:hypothetical protein